MKRKRGAQPSNKNAFKHGFYSKQFKASERRALSAMSTPEGMQEEIDTMRVHLLRFLEFDNKNGTELDYKTHLAKLRALSIYMGRMASLIRTQHSGAKSELEQAIEQAFDELRDELNID